MPKSPNLPKLLSTHDLAHLIQVDPSSIAKWIDQGHLVAYRTPGGHRRIRLPDAIAFLKKHQMPVPPEFVRPEEAEMRGAAPWTEATPTEATSAPAPTPQRRSARSAKPRLLLIDDPHWVDDSVKRLKTAFDLLATTSALEAMVLLAKDLPANVLVELNLKGGKGLELVKAIRGRPEFERIRLATMTALPSKISEKKSTAAGAEACFGKPLKVDLVRELFASGNQASRAD